MPAKPSLAALEKVYEKERVRTKVLELWREGKLSINETFKDRATVQALPMTGRPTKMTPRYVFRTKTPSPLTPFPHLKDT